MMIRGPNLAQGTTIPLVGSHVDVMPTLLGLATNIMDDSVVPKTMDGTNLAKYLTTTTTTDIDGNANRNFRQAGSNTKGTETTNFSRPTASLLIEYMSLGNVVRYQHMIDTHNHTFLALRIFDPSDSLIPNLKYIEFFDARTDWDFQRDALEYELYDLDDDPFEMHNKINEVPRDYRLSMHRKMMRMLRCRGQNCRVESRTGLKGESSLEISMEPYL